MQTCLRVGADKVVEAGDYAIECMDKGGAAKVAEMELAEEQAKALTVAAVQPSPESLREAESVLAHFENASSLRLDLNERLSYPELSNGTVMGMCLSIARLQYQHRDSIAVSSPLLLLVTHSVFAYILI